MDHLYDALEKGKIVVNDLSPRIQALRHQEDQLQATRMDLEGQLDQNRLQFADESVVRSYVESLKDVLSNSPLSEQKTFIRSFAKEVKVTGKEVLLKYTIPLPPDGLIEEKAGVLDAVQNGGR